MDGDEILANHMSDKGLVSRTYKEFSKLNSKNANSPSNENMGETLRDVSPKMVYRWQISK